MAEEEFVLGKDEELSLLETLDHVLDRGLVIAGEVTIAVADVDLIYLGLNLLLGSTETVNRVLGERERRGGVLRRPAAAPATEGGGGGCSAPAPAEGRGRGGCGGGAAR